eukprot:14765536-Alexandrium_andersonii.AAC.1
MVRHPKSRNPGAARSHALAKSREGRPGLRPAKPSSGAAEQQPGRARTARRDQRRQARRAAGHA